MKSLTRLLAVLALAMSIPTLTAAQQRVGVTTTVVGPVTVTRRASAPVSLQFKDDIFINDRIATGDQAFARMLLGGKAIVTARERSIITITEVPGVSTVDVLSGRISVAVEKSRMAPGEVVEIRTPNAVSGIRGTIVVAEVAGDVSTISVLRGLVDVYRRDPATGNAVGPAMAVGARQRVSVSGGVLPAVPEPLSVDQATGLSNEFTGTVPQVAPANAIVADEVSRAATLMGSGNSDPTIRSTTATVTEAATAATATVATASTTQTAPTVVSPASGQASSIGSAASSGSAGLLRRRLR